MRLFCVHFLFYTVPHSVMTTSPSGLPNSVPFALIFCTTSYPDVTAIQPWCFPRAYKELATVGVRSRCESVEA
jgi:hypothetical protein